jgi:hypothetical protein
VVLVGAGQHHRAAFGWDGLHQVELALERLGEAQSQEPDQLVHGGGRTAPDEEDDVVGRCSDTPRDGQARLLTGNARRASCRGVCAVDVGIER